MNLATTPESVVRTIHSIGAGRSIGALLMDAGRITPEAAERIIKLQKDKNLRFGEAAIELGLLSEGDIQHALSRQFEYPYLMPGDTSLSQEVVAAFKPFSPAVERLRALRSQLILRCLGSDSENRSLAIVSPENGEGRSYLAANLAVVFSQLGERTLLVDADLRRPRQHQLFCLGNQPGLSAVLSGRAEPESVISRIPNLLGLSVLAAGAVPPNPQELLGRPAFIELLNSINRDFDVVIIDTPAASKYADAQTIAVRAGSTLMLARKNRSSLTEIAELSRNLQQSGASLVGSVLNDA